MKASCHWGNKFAERTTNATIFVELTLEYKYKNQLTKVHTKK